MMPVFWMFAHTVSVVDEVFGIKNGLENQADAEAYY
jgi:hypothetical protein